MLLIIGLVLLGVWIIGFALFRAIVGGFIHVVLVLAVIALAWHFLAGGRQPSPTGTSASVSRPRVGPGIQSSAPDDA